MPETESMPRPGPPQRFSPPSRRIVLWVVAVVVVLGAAVWFGVPGPRGGGAPPAPGCTVQADVGSVPTGKAGDVVCLSGRSDERLTITAGGTPGAPVVYSGGGSTAVRGIAVTASNVVVQGFVSTDAKSVGAQLQGNGIVFRDNTIDHPVNAGDDTDGIRFFGDDITILRNTISNVNDGAECGDDGCGDGPHPDCLQTWYSDTYPTSSNVVIEGNRCAKVAAQCLMAEGPVLPGEGVNGPGKSTNWTFRDNYCDTGANQALMIKNITNVTITGNDFQGTNRKAIALAAGSTGAHVADNTVNPRIRQLITFDDNAEATGYVGPPPDKVSDQAPGSNSGDGSDGDSDDESDGDSDGDSGDN